MARRRMVRRVVVPQEEQQEFVEQSFRPVRRASTMDLITGKAMDDELDFVDL